MELKRELIKDNSELRLDSRKQLRGNWGMAVLLILVFSIITSAITYIGPKDQPYRIGVVLGWVLSGPFELGLVIAFMNIIRTQTVKFETIFDGFKKFGQAFLLQLLRTIFVALWGIPAIILFVIAFINFLGGAFSYRSWNPTMFFVFLILGLVANILPIIAYLRYSMAFYILNDNPELSAMEALKESSRMTKGFKGKLFLLYLSFIGWFILGTLALLIGLLWVVAYMKTSEANFYENLKGAYSTPDTSDYSPYSEI